MELIIGGAFQGKEAYARKLHPDIRWEQAGELDEASLLKAEGVLGFTQYIRRELEAGHEVSGLAERIIEENPGVVLVSDEVGCGVVPVDALDRQYREAVGRICTRLARHSSRVTRVICGIGTVIKNA